MDNQFKVLVFPCGSEVALEIYRSLKYARHVDLYGGSSISDHGQYVFDNYISDIPFVDEDSFIPALKKIIVKYSFDAIYPAMDTVIAKLKLNEEELGCKVISSPVETTEICLSKSQSYKVLEGVIDTPQLFDEDSIDINTFPIFAKPDVGYGSRGAKRIDDENQLKEMLRKNKTQMVLCEYLPGDEYTVDCFTNCKGELIFASGRKRNRISNGISVNTFEVNDPYFKNIAEKINNTLKFQGAWFYQVKKNFKDQYCLLEVASRLGGSSALFRLKGINFALLSIFDSFGYKVNAIENSYHISMDRALGNVFKVDIQFETIYVDFDDCLIIADKVNVELLSFLYKSLNENKKIILITKHKLNIHETLSQFRLSSLFDEIIHLNENENKFEFITDKKAIFIDDSYIERRDVLNNLKIPVFAPDMIEGLK
tara:strand:- start:29032 stop:30309 length:1278 start_codon:yes stop_codon:yes gene_type:complete